MKDLLTQISNGGVKNVDGRNLVRAFEAAGVKAGPSKHAHTTLLTFNDNSTLEIRTDHTVRVDGAIKDAARTTLALKAHAARVAAAEASPVEARL